MQIVLFLPHYQLVYANFDFSSFSLISYYLNERNITSVRTFLDNDYAGQRAVQEFVNAGFKVEDMTVYYRDFKDLNDYHVSRVREHEKSQNTSNKIKQVKLKIR